MMAMFFALLLRLRRFLHNSLVSSSPILFAIAMYLVFYADISLANLAATFDNRIVLRRRMLVKFRNK